MCVRFLIRLYRRNEVYQFLPVRCLLKSNFTVFRWGFIVCLSVYVGWSLQFPLSLFAPIYQFYVQLLHK
jgi:hypothetical protein